MSTRYGNWTGYARRMLSNKGAPTFAIWGGLTAAQLGLLAYLLHDVNATRVNDLLSAVVSPMNDPKTMAVLVGTILLLGILRSLFIVPMSHVLCKDEYVSPSASFLLALNGSRRVFVSSMVVSLLVVAASSVAVVLDVKLSLFVELPLISMLAMAPFLAARGENGLASVMSSITMSRKHWVVLFGFYIFIYIASMGLRAVTVLDLSQGIRLFCAYMAFEVIVWISSLSLFATIFQRESDA